MAGPTRRMLRLAMSKSCTMPCCPPTTMARPSLRNTPLYATSLKRAKVLLTRRVLLLYTVTRALLVAARLYG